MARRKKSVLLLISLLMAFALVAGILYAVAAVLFPAYFMFVIVEMVLSFVAYGLMKKAAAQPAAE